MTGKVRGEDEAENNWVRNISRAKLKGKRRRVDFRTEIGTKKWLQRNFTRTGKQGTSEESIDITSCISYRRTRRSHLNYNLIC